ncbi:MAG: hypothetical protein ACOYN6_13005 [Ignavibacteria bacterium]
MIKILSCSKVISVLAVLCIVCFSDIFLSCNVSTANLSDVKLCSSLSVNVCDNDVSAFPSNVAAIYCTANLNNAPSKTKVIFEWKQEGESIGKTEVEAESGYVSSTFKPETPLPPGKYSITVKIATDNSKPITKEYTVD